MADFTPIASALGGAMLGLAAAAMLVFNGRIAGISGIVGGVLEPGPASADRRWRLAFLVGLLLGGVALQLVLPRALPGAAIEPLPLLALAGVLVGFGTRLGSGCTSGHGVCGISRLSKRSLVATGVFMGVAMLVTFFVHNLLVLGAG